MLGWYWGQRDSADKGEPVKRTLAAFVLLAIGVLASEAYGYVRDTFREPDAYLVQIKEGQDRAFKDLQESLRALSGSVEGSGSEALAEVRDAVSAIKSANSGLIEQLSLAKEENKRLSAMAIQQAGVTGGYDILLTEDTGVALDARSALGLENINGGNATVNLSAAESTRARLASGEAIAYQDADGRACRVTLLSISGNGKSASFSKSCE